MMLLSDETAFRAGLDDLQTHFRDTLTPRQCDLYWLLLRDRVTLAEWQYACEHAMLRETYAKVPLLAHLLEYVREYRRAERGKLLDAQFIEAVASRATLHAMHERMGAQARVKRMINDVFPEEQ